MGSNEIPMSATNQLKRETMIESLYDYPALSIVQKKEMTEVFTDFETANRYSVETPEGQPLFFALEENRHSAFVSFMVRSFLKTMRPFTISLWTPDKQCLLRVERPFRFYFHEVSISDGDGRLLGHVKRRFSIVSRRYDVFDAQGSEVAKLYGPFFHPWTFHVEHEGKRDGKITKRWSGLGREMFTDADRFGIEFPSLADNPPERAVLLGAVFLIDFLHFEDRKN